MSETRIYNLYLPMDKGKAIHTKVDASIAILIHSPRYLTQPYIVYRESPYQIEISRYSKWEVSPDEKMREVFKEAVSSMRTFKEVKVAHPSLMVFIHSRSISKSLKGPIQEMIPLVNLSLM